MVGQRRRAVRTGRLRQVSPGAGLRAASQAVEIDPARLGDAALPELLGEGEAYLLDGLGESLDHDPARQEAMLHLYNMAVERGAKVLGDRPPSAVSLGDRSARPGLCALATLQAIELRPPDDALLGAVLVKLFADRNSRSKARSCPTCWRA